MHRKLASIQKIESLSLIPNADSIEKAKILGWECVVKKGEFFVGQPVVYMEVDSWLPERPEFEFLRKSSYKKNDFGSGFRIRTVKLRGQVSQGLVFPLSILPNTYIDVCQVGDDVTDILQVKKYEVPIPANLSGMVKGQFPSFIPKTDEIRVQNIQSVLNLLEDADCHVTEKLDGASVTFYLKDGQFGVCSRNLELKETPDNSIWKFARSNNLEEKFKDHYLKYGHEIALQGEIVGPGINGNRLKLSGDPKVFFYDVFSITNNSYGWKGVLDCILKEMNLYCVPDLEIPALVSNIETLVEFSKGKSILNPEVEREGIVVRPAHYSLEAIDAFYSITGEKRISFKVINPDYLLKYEE